MKKPSLDSRTPDSNTMKKRRRPTLKTIAEHTGLAVATVSRALSDAPDLKQETKNTVREVANKLGYVPDRAGLRLRTGRTNVISLVLPTELDIMNHTAVLISSIAAELRGTHYHLNITPFFIDQDPLDPIRYIVENHAADAVIFNQTTLDDPRARYLTERGFPFATHGRTQTEIDHPYFDFDNARWATLAIQTLADQQCKHVGLIAPPANQTYAQAIIQAAKAEAQRLGIKLHLAENTHADSATADIKQCVIERLRLTPSIDAYLCSSPHSAMATVSAAESMGRVLGKDFQVSAKEAVPILKQFRENIIVTHEDVARAGHFVAKAAIKAIQFPHAAPMQGLEVPGDQPSHVTT